MLWQRRHWKAPWTDLPTLVGRLIIPFPLLTALCALDRWTSFDLNPLTPIFCYRRMKLVTLIHDSVVTKNFREATRQVYPNPRTLSPSYCVPCPHGCQTLRCHHRTQTPLGLICVKGVCPRNPFPCKLGIYFLPIHIPRYPSWKSSRHLHSASIWWRWHSLSPLISPSLYLFSPTLVAFLLFCGVPYQFSVPLHFCGVGVHFSLTIYFKLSVTSTQSRLKFSRKHWEHMNARDFKIILHLSFESSWTMTLWDQLIGWLPFRRLKEATLGNLRFLTVDELKPLGSKTDNHGSK